MTNKPQFVGKKSGAALKDSCVLIMGQSPSSNSYNTSGDGLPFYQGNADFGEENPVPRSWCTEPKKIAEKGDILISVRAPIGAINIADEKCCIGRGVAAIRPNQEVMSPDFLQHQLFASRNKLKAMGTGSTFKAIGKKTLSDFPVVIYPKNTQEAIEQQLNSIKKQIKTANSQLDQLDSLVKSRFVEMFLSSSWPIATIGECSTDIRYGTSEKASAEGEYVYLRMNNMGDDGALNLSDTKRITLEGKALSNCLVRKGDLLFNRTNSREKVGKTCVFCFDEPMVIAGYIIRVRLDDRVDSVYLAAYMNLNSTKALLRGMAKGAVHQANINAKQLASIEFPLADIDVQKQFVSFVSQVDKSRFVAQQQIEKLQMLYDKLAQDYFG